MLHRIKEEESGDFHKVSGFSGAFESGMMGIEKSPIAKSVEISKKAVVDYLEKENPSNE
jgi:hypothetical protein